MARRAKATILNCSIIFVVVGVVVVIASDLNSGDRQQSKQKWEAASFNLCPLYTCCTCSPPLQHVSILTPVHPDSPLCASFAHCAGSTCLCLGSVPFLCEAQQNHSEVSLSLETRGSHSAFVGAHQQLHKSAIIRNGVREKEAKDM